MNAFESLKKAILILPNWEKAQKHALATLVGKPPTSNHNIQEESNFCQCCGHAIQKEAVSLCQNTKQLGFIGIGFPLYFIFLKYCIMLLLLESVSVSITSLTDAIDNNKDFCINDVPKIMPFLGQQVTCTSIFVYWANINEYLFRDTILIRIVYFLITILFFVYMRDTLIKAIAYYDERSTTFSDYSFMLKQLPQTIKIREKLQTLLTRYQVCKIVVIGEFDHIQKMEHQIEKKHQQKKKVVEQIEDRDNNILQFNALMQKAEYLDKQIEQLELVFLQMIINQQNLYKKDEIIPHRVIISVETDQQKEEIIQKIKSGDGLNMPQDWTLEELKGITVAQSPQPREIIWHNLHVPLRYKVRNYIIGWILTFTILAIISAIFYFSLVNLSAMLESKSENDLEIAKTFFYITLILIIFVNKFIICPILYHICHFEKYFTKTKEEYGFTVKYLLSMFFTSAVMTILVEGITNKNIYARHFGVIESESIMIIFTSFLIPLIWLINPWTICIKIKQIYYKNNKNISQAQANHIMEPMAYQMGKRYAEIVKLIWLVSMYQSIIPIGTIVATLGIGFYYWVDKYNLLRRSSVKQAVSGYLTLKIMTLLEFSMVLKYGGEIYFDLQIRYQYSISSIVCLLIGTVYMILPMNQILEYIHSENFNKEQKKLSLCMKKLGSSYQDLHPVMGKKMMNLVDQLGQKQYKQTDRLLELNDFSFAKSILNQISLKESDKINTRLKTWKKSFSKTSRFIQQDLLCKQDLGNSDL